MALPKVMYVQDMKRFIQSSNMIKLVILSRFVEFIHSLVNQNSKFVYIFIPRKTNNIRLFITSECSPSLPETVQIFREIMVDFYIGT